MDAGTKQTAEKRKAMTPLERAARAVAERNGYVQEDGHISYWEDCLADVRAVLTAIREPSLTSHNAGAFSEAQSKPPRMVLDEETGVVRIEWAPANPSGIWQAMIDALLAEGT